MNAQILNTRYNMATGRLAKKANKLKAVHEFLNEEVQKRYTMDTLDKTQQLMVITSEEAGELTQACSKVLRRAEIEDEYGEKLIEELGDIYCMLKLMVEHDVCTWKELEERAQVKRTSN